MPVAAPNHRPAGKKEREPWQRTMRTEGKTTTERGYGWKWQKQRKRIIARDNGLCQPCMRQNKYIKFDEIDHVIPKAQGGTDDDDNLECICIDCHKQKTQREKRY